MYALSNAAFASGLSSLMIVIIGWLLGLYLLKRYVSSPDYNTLALAVILISVGSVWLTIAINFLFALLDIPFLTSLPYLFIVGWIPGVVSLATVYVFTSIVKTEYLKPAMIIFTLFLAVNILISYILIPFGYLGFKVEDALTIQAASGGDLPNASTTGFFSLLSGISIIIMFITAIFFLITAYRTSIPLVKARAGLLGIGLILISFLIIFDSVFPTNQISILIILRFGVVIALFIIAISIVLPKKIFKNLE